MPVSIPPEGCLRLQRRGINHTHQCPGLDVFSKYFLLFSNVPFSRQLSSLSIGTLLPPTAHLLTHPVPGSTEPRPSLSQILTSCPGLALGPPNFSGNPRYIGWEGGLGVGSRASIWLRCFNSFLPRTGLHSCSDLSWECPPLQPCPGTGRLDLKGLDFVAQ